MMSNYEDEQSEDGELAQSPVPDEMDFSLSDEDRDHADSLEIKPPQAVVKPSHRVKRSHKRSGKDRYKDTSRKAKKHLYRDRDNLEKPKRDDSSKDYYRDKQYYREKDIYRDRDKEGREKEVYREKDARDKEVVYREKEVYKEKDAYRERDHYREREMYKETFREAPRSRDPTRDGYREKGLSSDKDVQRDRDNYLSRERQYKHEDRRRQDMERVETRLRGNEQSHSNQNNEKENREKSSGDKELEDLRSRLLSKRKIELQSQDSKKRLSDNSDNDSKQSQSSRLDKHQQERRNRFIEAEREMEKRKMESRTALEARREDRRRRGRKRSPSPAEVSNKKSKTQQSPEYKEGTVVEVSDASDVEIRSESGKSDPEEGEHTQTESEESSNSESEAESKSEEEDDAEQSKQSKEKRESPRAKSKSKSLTPKSERRTPSSRDSRRSLSRSKSRSRSRSHSFSPPPPNENGKADEEKPAEDEEKVRKREEAINALPPYYPALQGCRSVEEFQCLNRIEEGTYGVVYRARDKTTDEIVALKRLKMEKEKEGFPITSLREINTLLKARHLLREVLRGLAPRPLLRYTGGPKNYLGNLRWRHMLKPLLLSLEDIHQNFRRGKLGNHIFWTVATTLTDFINILIRRGVVLHRSVYQLKSTSPLDDGPLRDSAIRESKKEGQHPNIVTVREIVVGSNMDKIFIVMDYVEHDLKSLMETMRGKKQVFLPGEVKCLMTQLLKAVHHLHDNWILHRDLKTSNLLLSHKGILKVGDFGLAREYGSPLRQYTPIVVTLWYRAPELLLCGKEYSTPIDMWSVGCIFAEFVTMNPLFPGKSEVDQLNRIFKDLGTPSDSIWPGYSQLPAVQKMTFAEHPAGGLRTRVGKDLLSDQGHSLLHAFLNYDPVRRITADAALEHPYFQEQPVAIEPAMFPTWPAKSEGNRRSTHSPRPPAGGAAYAQYARGDSDEALGFQLQKRSLNVAPGFSLKF